MDIVERLRSASIYNPHEAENLCEKAADEIERLREELKWKNDHVERLAKAMHKMVKSVL